MRIVQPPRHTPGVAVVFGLAPFYRYLLGMHLVDTGGSLLAIGIQHAARNEAGDLGFVDGDWQVLAAVVPCHYRSAGAGSRGTP